QPLDVRVGDHHWGGGGCGRRGRRRGGRRRGRLGRRSRSLRMGRAQHAQAPNQRKSNSEQHLSHGHVLTHRLIGYFFQIASFMYAGFSTPTIPNKLTRMPTTTIPPLAYPEVVTPTLETAMIHPTSVIASPAKAIGSFSSRKQTDLKCAIADVRLRSAAADAAHADCGRASSKTNA